MMDRAKEFFRRYERWVSPVTLIGGFIFDNITLKRIDLVFSNVLLIFYLVVSALSIMLLNIHEHKKADGGASETYRFIGIFTLQFCLGGLLSASLLFYSKSGTLIASWPFLVMLIAYVAGNELLRKNYVRLGFQVAVFFTTLFSFMIFFLPVILGKMGDAIFLLSGIASVILTGLFMYVLSWFAPSRTARSAPMVALSVIGIYAAVNALYFTNLIPPIPLSLKEVGVYRSVTRLSDGSYQTVGEEQDWFHFFKPDPTLRVVEGQPLYALTSVFAPARLATDIAHVWRYYDRVTEQWVTASKIDLSISGGRDNGFRTYSVKENLFPGKWRVDVETPRGQLVGRLSFELEPSNGTEELVSEVK